MDSRLNEYSTSDMAAVAALYVEGFTPLRVDASNSRRIEFFYEDDPCLRMVVRKHYDFRLYVSSQQMAEALKYVKKLIYGGTERKNDLPSGSGSQGEAEIY